MEAQVERIAFDKNRKGLRGTDGGFITIVCPVYTLSGIYEKLSKYLLSESSKLPFQAKEKDKQQAQGKSEEPKRGT